MGKIKLNLVSGAVVEKPLICAFKSGESSYVVLDNELNGSMGLPIILVSKNVSGRLVKIEDQTEWQNVKEALKSIIAGNNCEYITVNNEMPADDIYYTQLTLPIPSFDSLKNNYVVNSNEETNILGVNLEEANNETPPSVQAEPVQEAVNVAPNIVSETPTPEVGPINNVGFGSPLNEVKEEAQNIEAEITNPINMDIPSINNTEPEITPTPVIESPVEQNKIDDSLFNDQKQAFLEACGNMFDALVQKFKQELENKKN